MAGFVPFPDVPILDRGNPFTKGIIGCWPLNEKSPSSDAYDVSGYGEHGTRAATVKTAGGPYGNAFYNDLTAGAIVTMGTKVYCTFSEEFSVSWSQRVDSSPGSFPVPWQLRASGGGNFAFFAYSTESATYKTFAFGSGGNERVRGSYSTTAVGKYLTITVTYNGGIGALRTEFYDIYVNGELLTTTTAPALGDFAQATIIGSRNGGNPFDGIINNLIVHNRKLSSSEVKTYHSNPSSIYVQGIELSQWISGTFGPSLKAPIQSTKGIHSAIHGGGIING